MWKLLSLRLSLINTTPPCGRPKLPPTVPCRSGLRVRRPRFLRAGYLRNAASFLVFTALYAATNIVLFSWRVWQYRDRALLEQMARGTGEYSG